MTWPLSELEKVSYTLGTAPGEVMQVMVKFASEDGTQSPEAIATGVGSPGTVTWEIADPTLTATEADPAPPLPEQLSW